jgi:dCMP deaminase
MELKYKRLYKTVLKEYQKLSKCSRLKVAALLVDNGRIISCGYNGTPSGQPNCNELFKNEAGKFYCRKTPEDDWEIVTEEEWRTRHHEFSNEHELHAEQNCLGYCLKCKMDISGASMALSHEPCESCARLIYAAGIKYVMYVNKYDRGSNGIQFLKNTGVKVEKI